MADVKISALPAATTPLTGGEVLPVVQSGVTTKVAVSNLTAGLAGTASININGTVGATTPTTGAFTSGTFSTTLGVTGAVTSNGNFRSNPSRYTSLGLLSQTNLGGGWDGGINVSDVNQVGLGFPNTYFPVALAAIQTSASGYGVADLVIATRAATTDTAPIERLRITGAGAVTIPGTLGVTGLITATNAGIAVPTGAAGTCHSGTYTPTLTNGTNIASSSPQVMQFMRVGNTVTVGGYINIDTTATGASSLRMSLPVASNFTSSVDAGGVGSRPSTAANDSWNMYANSATDDIQIDGYSTTTAAENLFITLVYQVK